MRYLEVTHTYVLPVPAEEEQTLDAVAQRGVSIMENFISTKASNIRELKSDWKLMPKEYQPSKVEDPPTLIQTQAIPASTPGGIHHPWEDGIRITPPDHAYADAETLNLYEEGLLCGASSDQNYSPGEVCILVKNHPGPHYPSKMPGNPDTVEGTAKEITDGETE